MPVCLFVPPSAIALTEGGSDAARFIPVLVPHPGVGQLNVLLVFDLHPVTKTGTQIYVCVHNVSLHPHTCFLFIQASLAAQCAASVGTHKLCGVHPLLAHTNKHGMLERTIFLQHFSPLWRLHPVSHFSFCTGVH